MGLPGAPGAKGSGYGPWNVSLPRGAGQDGAPGHVPGAVASIPTTAIPCCTGTYILPSTIAGPPPPGVAAAGSPTLPSSPGLRLVVAGVTGPPIPDSIRTTSSRV